MNKKWFKYILPDTMDLKEIREWCNDNCSGRFSVKPPKKTRTLNKGYKAKFQKEEDAIAFKLRWF